MDTRRWAGGVALGMLLVMGILVGSPLGTFIDVPSAILTFGGGLAAWLAASGKAVPALFKTLQREVATPSELARARATVQAGRRSFWLVAGAATMVGLTQMLQALDDPAAIGPALAVSMLPLFYAFVADLFIASPLAHRVAAKQVSAAVELDVQHAVDADLAQSRATLEALRARARQSKASDTVR